VLRYKPEFGRIDIMEKTVKTHAFPDGAKIVVPQNNLTEAQEKALEHAKKNALIAEEKNKLLEHLKTIEQMRESLKQEQARTAEMAKKAAGLEAKVKELSEQETQEKKVAELEAKIKELSEALGKISGIAAAGKVG
jgi:DNA repair exonuclease SbcCD ATPase subunit